MTLDVTRTRSALQTFDFPTLFVEELGWDHQRGSLTITVDQRRVTLEAIAHKRGMVAYRCPTPAGDVLPDYSTRRQIEQQVAKAAHEHFIIFTDEQTTQVWQWVKREPGKPTACREHRFERGQSGEALIQKLAAIAFTLDEEERLTLVEVTGRARKGFDTERVTKRFYEQFQKQHAAFLKWISGIAENAEQEWYASVMLNRLMFVYFMQRKGFLDGDRDYLQNRLAQCQHEQGHDQFYSFYRYFLLRLFHEGLGGKTRSPELEGLIGQVPYLNGGIFDQHDIEKRYPAIKIPDQAFTTLFTYFDQYQWHLDERPLRKDDEINPDVLGYIFEKYINQKQMGAYYTKEDITEYIGKSTLIPFLLDAAKASCAIAFENPNGPVVWDGLKVNPDGYIYPAVQHGVDLPLPPEIAIGVDTTLPNLLERRKEWNKPAPAEYALPTEIWREVVARRTRCLELRAKLAAGEVCDSNDLITLNLDCRQFAQDVIQNCEGPELLRAFWQALEKVTVLDPTCGSGAFLFAALNILQPLYEAVLDRMEAFVADVAHTRQKTPEPFADFRQILQQVATHPNRAYFILKRIILNNLFGVDIMEEATEICKLRLFLKLAAQVEPDSDQPNLGIEPLPDIDFNIRAGNTLIGFATEQEFDRIGNLASDQTLQNQIKARIAALSQSFAQFRNKQMASGQPVTAQEKQDLQDQLKALNHQLNGYLAVEYGKNPNNPQWLKSHQPFHWFVEFYAIMKSGGFDVIIGNPPYVNAAKVRKQYSVKNLIMHTCPDIYAWVLERAQWLLRNHGRTGMIVPLSLGFSGDFAPIRSYIYSAYHHNWFSSFGRIPSALFSFDVRVRNIIHLGQKNKDSCEGANYTSRLHRWFEMARPSLLSTLEYACFQQQLWKGRIPKLNTQRLVDAFEKCLSTTSLTVAVATSSRTTPHVLHFKKTAYNWLNFCRNMPPCFEGSQRVKHTKFGAIYFPDANACLLAMLLGNGKLEFAFWCAIGDDFDVTRWNFADFPIDFTQIAAASRSKLLALVPELERAMEQATQFKLNAGRQVGNYNLAKCRHITDQSDLIFAESLGFRPAWDDVELYCSQVVRTDFSDTDDDE